MIYNNNLYQMTIDWPKDELQVNNKRIKENTKGKNISFTVVCQKQVNIEKVVFIVPTLNSFC